MTRTIFALALALLTVFLANAPTLAQTPGARTQVRFVGPAGMKVQWYVRAPDGREGYSEPALAVPGRYNFRQGAGYRLRLSHIPGHTGLVLYPTLEVVAPGPAVQGYLAHSAVALRLTDEDFRQVAAGRYVVRAAYLPASAGQAAGDALLESGADAVGAAQRRGHVLLVLRMGNADREVP
jgi:hypothetical protein